jgi:hypothetical protein
MSHFFRLHLCVKCPFSLSQCAFDLLSPSSSLSFSFFLSFYLLFDYLFLSLSFYLLFVFLSFFFFLNLFISLCLSFSFYLCLSLSVFLFLSIFCLMDGCLERLSKWVVIIHALFCKDSLHSDAYFLMHSIYSPIKKWTFSPSFLEHFPVTL